MQLDDRVWAISSPDGRLEIEAHDPATADADLETDPATLNALLFDPAGLDVAIASGSVRAEGSMSALRRLIAVATSR